MSRHINQDEQMDRVNKIYSHKKFTSCLSKINNYEVNRRHCKHDINHLLDVARITYILNLEYNLKISKDIIYATALLHDIGKMKQYTEGIPHQIASAEIAKKILKECGYKQEEIEIIIEAILNHRNNEIKDQKDLNGIIYQGDKLSRKCHNCDVEDGCHWEKSKKNMTIKY